MTDLFDVVVARKLSGGGGGGGSSDFSTATVTIASASEQEFVDNLLCAILIDDELRILNSPDVGTFTVPLYKGSILFSYVGINKEEVQVFGNATYDVTEGSILITGDCTITIS